MVHSDPPPILAHSFSVAASLPRMDPVAAAAQSSEKNKSPMSTPLKPPGPMRTAAIFSPSHQIATPEKPIELPRRTRSRSVAFSVKDVRKVASGLLQSSRVPSDKVDMAGQSKDASPAEDLVLGPGNDGTRPKHMLKPRIELPEKYEILLEFFNCLVSSIRLLHLKGRMTSFSKIYPQVESLTNRRFSYGHLAQLKYILPEAICVKKILLYDEATCCMKPDLQVTLQTDAFVSGKDQSMGSGYSLLIKMFRQRVINFFKDHPQEDEVPEMDLPDPFNQTKRSMLPGKTMCLISRPSSSITKESSSCPSEEEAAAPSHMPRSFQRRFSQKALERLPVSHANESSEGMPPLIPSAPSPIKNASNPPVSKSLVLTPSHSRTSSISAAKDDIADVSSSVDASPKKHASMGTPAKTITTPARLMSITPQLQTPKRCRPDASKDCTPEKTFKRSTRTKLFTTPVKKCETKNEESEAAVDDVLKFLPKALLQSVREKEKKTLEDQEAGVAEAEKRQRMLACLPKLFDMILLIFQSLRRSVITKQELIYRIIANHHDIVDRGEVVEQLVILHEVAPDWISERTSSSGDLLICFNNTLNTEDIRRRLSGVK